MNRMREDVGQYWVYMAFAWCLEFGVGQDWRIVCVHVRFIESEMDSSSLF